MSNKVTVQALTPAALPLLLQFFDGKDAFADNPCWSFCYCPCFYEGHKVVKWTERTAEQNRALACCRSEAAEMQGYIASRRPEWPARRLVRCRATPPAACAGR